MKTRIEVKGFKEESKTKLKIVCAKQHFGKYADFIDHHLKEYNEDGTLKV